MRLGICTAPENLTQPVPNLDYAEATVGGLLAPQESDQAFQAKRKQARACAVPVEAANCFLPGALKSTGPDVAPDVLDAYVRTAMARAEQVGIRVIVFGSGGSRRVPDGFDRGAAAEQIVGHLKRWGPIARDHGVTIAIEPLQQAECNILTTVGEAADIARRAGDANVRVLADTFHMACDEDPAEAIVEAGELIVHVHCAEKQDRAPIGTHGEDLRAYWRALKRIGYQGRVSIECRWQDLTAQAPAALAALKRQIEQA